MTLRFFLRVIGMEDKNFKDTSLVNWYFSRRKKTFKIIFWGTYFQLREPYNNKLPKSDFVNNFQFSLALINNNIPLLWKQFMVTRNNSVLAYLSIQLSDRLLFIASMSVRSSVCNFFSFSFNQIWLKAYLYKGNEGSQHF